MLNTRTMAEPLLAAAEKTEGRSHHLFIWEVSLQGCLCPPDVNLSFPASILPSAAINWQHNEKRKNRISRHPSNKPFQDPVYVQKHSPNFSALVHKGTTVTKGILPAL